MTMWDNSDWAFSHVFVRMNPVDIPQTLGYVEKTWAKPVRQFKSLTLKTARMEKND